MDDMQLACIQLTPHEAYTVEHIPIVGMRFYGDSAKRLCEAREEPIVLRQCLYLLPDENNPFDENAVMLYDGKRMLVSGHVGRDHAKAVRNLFKTWEKDSDEKYVIVCHISQNKRDMSLDMPKTFVTGVWRVNERIARKFCSNYRKEM